MLRENDWSAFLAISEMHVNAVVTLRRSAALPSSAYPHQNRQSNRPVLLPQLEYDDCLHLGHAVTQLFAELSLAQVLIRRLSPLSYQVHLTLVQNCLTSTSRQMKRV
jgi:hypothetical protein